MRTSEQIEINVGYSAHGQKAVLKGGTDGTGRWSWSIRLEPRDFHEQAIQIDGLTGDLVRQLAQAVEKDGR